MKLKPGDVVLSNDHEPELMLIINTDDGLRAVWLTWGQKPFGVATVHCMPTIENCTPVAHLTEAFQEMKEIIRDRNPSST